MRLRSLALPAAVLALSFALPAQAQTEIQFWHSMTAVNNEWVNDLAKQFNESQKEFKIVPTFKGTYASPAGGKPVSFSGAVFQKLNSAYGALYSSGDQTSEVRLSE